MLEPLPLPLPLYHHNQTPNSPVPDEFRQGTAPADVDQRTEDSGECDPAEYPGHVLI